MIAAIVLAATLETFLAPYESRGELAAAVVQDGRVVAVYNGDAVFRMASLSKVVTALAVIRSGADLDDEIAYGDGVTMHHLLTHTSGIEDALYGNTVPISEEVSLAEHFRRRPPRFGRYPGSVLVYSNEGLTLAGHVAAKSEPFDRFVQRTVLAPLGMTRSSFTQPPPFAVVASGAEGERLVQAPAGAMVGTANDMARLLLYLLSEEPAARLMREKRYGLFEFEGAFFHTGRSGHESVLWLDPLTRRGVFLVHTGGMPRDLRKRFVARFGGWRRPRPSYPPIFEGTYQPVLLPVHRPESAARVATDTRVRREGHKLIVTLPPFARGETLVFEQGMAPDGSVLYGYESQFIMQRPLAEPISFRRVFISGRTKLIVALAAFLVVLTAIRTPLFAAVAGLVALAPVAFLANYLPRGAETRPFHVETSVHLALAMLFAGAAVALIAPLIAWKTRKAASVAAVILALFVVHLLAIPLLS